MPPAIAILGDRDPAYVTHRGIDAAMRLMQDAEIRWLGSDDPAAPALAGFDAVWVAPGTPYRDDDAVLAAIEHARTSGMPILGTCGGFQHMLVEFARNVAGIAGAAHAETAPAAADPVVAALACSLVGETRQVTTVPGTRTAELCGPGPFAGFHWCTYGLAPEREAALEAAGLVVAARAQDAGVEAVELPGHPFYLATLFQPQMDGTRPGRVHPLLQALQDAANQLSPRSS